jgi:glucokinase
LSNTVTIGVDIGGTRTKYGLVNTATGEVVKSFIHPTVKTDADKFLQQTGNVINECKNYVAQTDKVINGIGFGIPGFTTKDGMVITTYGFLTFMENYPLKALVEKEFGLPCLLDNDARIVGLGEALYGKGKDYKRVLTLTLGTGLGLGFVVEKKFIDALPLAHMGGHLKVTDVEGNCYCGKVGCLEALVSSSGIIELAKKSNVKLNEITSESIFKSAANGNIEANEVLEKVCGYLHTGIHNYANLFAPDMVVLGGGVAQGLLPYLQRIKGKNYMGPYPAYDFKLVVSQLEAYAGMLGSAALFSEIKSSEC